MAQHARIGMGLIVIVALSGCAMSERGEPTDEETNSTKQPLTTLLSDDFSGFSGFQSWAEGTTHGNWVDRFNGFGGSGVQNVGASYGEVLWLKPATSTSPTETHSALVTSSASFSDMTYTVSVQLAQQLRTGSPPNAWEAPWVVWDSANVSGCNRFYYLALKPTGWEFGKADPDSRDAAHQTFFQTGSSPSGAVYTWHTVTISQGTTGATSIWIDGTQVVNNFTDPGAYIARYASGNVGLYSEDAYIMADNVTVTKP